MRLIQHSVEFDDFDDLLFADVCAALCWLAEDATAADRIFSMLMGDQVAPRRAFIETHAKEVKFLDV